MDDAVFALNLSIKLGRVEISAFLEWHQLIRSIDRVSLEVLHFSKKCYSPGGAMTAGILLLCQWFFEELFLLCIRCQVVTVVENETGLHIV